MYGQRWPRLLLWLKPVSDGRSDYSYGFVGVLWVESGLNQHSIKSMIGPLAKAAVLSLTQISTQS